MCADFIAFEPRKQRHAASQPVPPLLFVACDQRNGGTQAPVKAYLRRHVMRTHLYHRSENRTLTKKKNRSPAADLAPPPAPPDDVADSDRVLGDPRATLGDSIGALSLPFETTYNVANVLQWMVAGHDAMQAARFTIARSFHVQDLWEWARTRKLALDGLALYMCRKKVQLAGESVSSRREYLRQKGDLIEGIRREIAHSSIPTDGDALFAIVALASCLVLEGDLGIGSMHLTALRSLQPPMHDSPFWWIFLWSADLRLALYSGTRPVLDRVHPNLIECYAVLEPTESTRSAAMWLALLSPKAPDDLLFPQTADLFERLLRFCSISNNLAAATSLPFHALYDIEYELRMRHAYVLSTTPSPTRMCIELTILAIQMTVWIAARFFAPLTPQMKHVVLGRVHHLLASVSPSQLLATWTELAQAQPVSLLWVLSLFTSCLAADNDELVPLARLAYVIDHLSIGRKEDFLVELGKWPSQTSWSPCWYSRTWAKVREFKSGWPTVEISPKNTSCLIASEEYAVPKLKMPFFGPFEFWDM